MTSLPGDWQPLLTKISEARAGKLAPDLARPTILQLIELIDALRAARLRWTGDR